MTNKKAAPTVPQVQQKAKPLKKSARPQLILTGYEAKVDILVEKKQEIEAAAGVMETGREELDPLATEFRERHENDGLFSKNVIVKGTTLNACYTFKDAYAKIDTAVEKDLQSLLGPIYPKLFKRVETGGIKDGCFTTLKALAEKYGFEDLLEEDKYLMPVDDFREKRAEERSSLSTEQNKALDEVVRQVSPKPSVSYK
jgi:hypothetical protein